MPSRYALAAGVMALALLVSACVVEVTPHGAGVYSVRPVTLQAAPDVTPTPEVVQTPTPTPNAPPVVACMVGAIDANINIRAVPGGDILGLFRIGDAAQAYAQTTYNDLRYWRIDAGWIADFVAETGACETLPVEQPAPPF